MQIQIWSDYVCPFCYIGKKRLERALAQFPFKEEVELELKSFELDQNAAEYSGKNIHELIAGKYNISVDQAKENNKAVGEQANLEGLSFDFDNMKPTNTFDAHRLVHLAKKHNKGNELSENLFEAYFANGKHIGEKQTLLDLAVASGLDKEDAEKVIDDKTAFANDVRIDEAIAQQYRVTGVPFFVINQKYAISGAQPIETFISALGKVWEEENAQPTFQDLSTHSDASCTEDGCAIDDKQK